MLNQQVHKRRQNSSLVILQTSSTRFEFRVIFKYFSDIQLWRLTSYRMWSTNGFQWIIPSEQWNYQCGFVKIIFEGIILICNLVVQKYFTASTVRNKYKSGEYVKILWRQCGVRGGTIGWAGRSRVRFLMVSLKFFIDIIFPVALWPWGWLRL